ncbi:hypothetical protein BJ973_003345 [Actinoplanes tereljensis]|uniref:Uncharacterized protein n=1 Tax=Paractinoplanes tereljensis TaxID=571912 RepID=A0A919TXB2_9ACTN|nr:DUF6188 family protein [Actinoplanes tereljensis]GIF26076.1 hypothetical protein Ate02nite_88060 [Actinoplanes tereljensis]
MDLGFGGEHVVRWESGWTVALEFSGGFEVRIETAFVVRSAGSERHVTPGDDVELADLDGAVVSEAVGDDSGGLRIVFQDGTQLLAAADPGFEAWTLAGPDGLKVVSEPGGGLAVWSAAS